MNSNLSLATIPFRAADVRVELLISLLPLSIGKSQFAAFAGAVPPNVSGC